MSYCLPCSPDKHAIPHSAVPFSHALGPVLYEYGCTQVLQIKKHKKDVGSITNASTEDTGSNPEPRTVFPEAKKHWQFIRASERILLLPPLIQAYCCCILNFTLRCFYCSDSVTVLNPSLLRKDQSLKIANFYWHKLKLVQIFVPIVLFLSKITGFYQSANASQQETNTDLQDSLAFLKNLSFIYNLKIII